MHLIQTQPAKEVINSPLIAIIESESGSRDEKITKLENDYHCSVQKFRSLGHFVNESQLNGVPDFDLILITYNEDGYPSTNLMPYLNEFGSGVLGNSYIVGRVSNCEESKMFMNGGIDWIVKEPLDENDYRIIAQGAHEIRNAKRCEEFRMVLPFR